MNPDTTSPEYQIAYAARQSAERKETIRRKELHNKALERRKKAKRGGRR